MNYKVVFLHNAELDLRDLKNYIVENFSNQVWQVSYMKIKNSIARLKSHPKAGRIPSELKNLNITQYRQIISGKNRIIYEVRQKIIFIHIICDVRRNIKSVLTKRLLRIDD